MKAPREYTPAEIAKMREAVARLGNRSAAALELDLPRTTIVRHTRDIHGSPMGGGFNPVHAHRHPERSAPQATMGDVTHRPGREPIDVTGDPTSHALRAAGEPKPTPEPSPKVIDWEEKGDTASVSFASDKLIRTEQEAIAFADVDLSVWYVKSFKVGGWSTTMRLRAGQDADKRWKPDAGHVKQNWRVSLELARILPKPFLDAADAIFNRMAEHAPHYPAIHYAKPKAPALLIVDLFDVHFGKLAWRRETGQDYDLRIAERIFAEALEDILSEASGRDIERIIIPAGNDFFHIDNPKNETTAGTPQDTDGRFHKIIEVGEMAMIRAVERAREIAPVQLLHVPGNHDRTASWNMARTVRAWFRNCPDVTVDLEPKSRKYIAYNRNFVAFTHGNEEKVASLPIIMASEERQMWAATDYAEWHLGHLHKKGQTETVAVGDHDGVKVRRLQSLSGRDYWHFMKGYGCGKRAAEAFLYDSKTGNVHGIEVSLRRAS